MKKIFLYIVLVLIIIIVVILVQISNNNKRQASVMEFNSQFESYYKDKTLYGADVLTIINKAIDNNESYNIEKDENGFYINDRKICLSHIPNTAYNRRKRGEKRSRI